MRHQNILLQLKYNILKEYTNWYPVVYIKKFNEEIVPKFLDMCVDDSKKISWNNYFDVINPKNSLGYMTSDIYLQANNLTKKQVIQNSIKYVLLDFGMSPINFTTLLSGLKIFQTRNFDI